MISLARTATIRRIVFSLALASATVFSMHGGAVDARRASPTPSPTPIPTPTPTPLPTPPGFDVRIARLSDQLAAIAKTTPGDLGIAVFDPASDAHISVHGDRAFPLAGTYTIAVALATFHLVDERKLNLDLLVPISAGDLRRGHSPIAEQYPQGGASLPLWRLVRAMLVDGDTTATDLVLRAIGEPGDVQNALNNFKLAGFSIRKTDAELYQDALEKKPFARGGDNAGTPDGIAALLAGMSDLKFLSLDTTTEFLLDFGQTHGGESRLRAGFPTHVAFGHKSGSTDAYDGTTDATNDAGLLTLPDGHRIAIAVFLSESTADSATRDAVFANVAKAAYAAFAPT